MKKEQLCDDVLKLLSKNNSLKLLDISKNLSIKSTSDEYSILKSALEFLVEQGVITKSSRHRFSLSNNLSSGIEGILHIDNNINYVETNDTIYPIIFIPNNFLYTALDGDTVLVKLILQDKKKKVRGEIVDVINRNNTLITGIVELDEHFYFLIPDNPNLKLDFLIPKDYLSGARDGDKVSAEFIKWDNPSKNPIVKVKSIIGRAGDPLVEYEAIVKEFKLPTDFPTEVKNEVKSFKPPLNRKYSSRLDLRNELIITVDPATARDFDDAVSLKRLENGNYLLGVHIADVSNYVKENSALDKEAWKRGNSVYLVDRVIPMLPKELSNIICSLNPGEPRYTFSVIMEIDSKYEVINYSITPSIIKSKRRYSYEEVQDIIDRNSGDNFELILELNKLAKRLKLKRTQEGSINYDTQEIKYILDDEDKMPVDVEIHKTTEATSLIEECMLLANRTVAKHIKKYTDEYKLPTPIPFIYRIHDKPKTDALNEALEFIKNLGYKINSKNITSNVINDLLEKVKFTPENTVINQILIRAMSKAVYSDVNIGHYGLGFADYTHFTSPIRRYPDLIVHRFLKEYVLGKPSAKRLKELAMIARDAAQHSSDTERYGVEAERASNKLAGVIYANMLINEDRIFSGTITGVVQYGLFILLDEIYCEGLLHTRDMLDDYYQFDATKMRIVGKKTKKVFTLGLKIAVRIKKVSIEKRQIDLIMIEK